jgi:phage terminase large subunit-like protein
LDLKRIQTREEGNPNYPLPADYESLTKEGQRLARVNACSQWLLNEEDIAVRGNNLVTSVWWFDRYYLSPDDEADFNPLFYDDTPLETPDFHWVLLRQWAGYRMTAAVAPRGSAKSYLNCKDMLLRLITRPAYSFVYATSTHPNAREVGERIKRQLIHNQRLHDDFAPEFDGRIVPRRGEGSFSTEHMILNNGSWLRLLSASSKQRGGRPRRYRLDDPEYDPKSSTPMSVLRAYMDELLFKIVIPMVTRPDTGVDWVGTFVSKRHYLWHAMQLEETPEGLRAKDPRFNRWSRLVIPAAIEENGEMVSCWPDMWPATRKERAKLAETRPRFKEALSLEEIREAIGPANFASEYLAAPGDGTGAFFGELDEVKHRWWYEEVDENILQPLVTGTLICWYERVNDKFEPKKMPLSEFVGRYARMFITADTSHTTGTDSDFKVCCLMAVTPQNDLFVLDLWAKQGQESELVKAVFAMADTWKCPTVHPETIRQGVSLFNALNSIVSTRARDMAGVEHLPKIVKLNPGMAEKQDKIAGLQFRFEHGKIKLPMWRREQLPWRYLFDQIESFNPEAQDGGLEKDDCIDAVAMSQFVLKGRLSKPAGPSPDRTLFERLRDGDYYNEDGTHIGEGLNLDCLTAAQINEILDARTQYPTSTGESKI